MHGGGLALKRFLLAWAVKWRCSDAGKDDALPEKASAVKVTVEAVASSKAEKELFRVDFGE